ncbi:hypothetical protein PIB30_077110 [Stylosanthes scabra]|uniref:Uncharacterized protein n=1 Tax=Stylosanthes scabra TaxID=79078 RepID=A0ABU6TPZ5_9FABA|nr:hypothetical protein [Stylosanthes scabra]
MVCSGRGSLHDEDAGEQVDVVDWHDSRSKPSILTLIFGGMYRFSAPRLFCPFSFSTVPSASPVPSLSPASSLSAGIFHLWHFSSGNAAHANAATAEMEMLFLKALYPRLRSTSQHVLGPSVSAIPPWPEQGLQLQQRFIKGQHSSSLLFAFAHHRRAAVLSAILSPHINSGGYLSAWRHQ